MYTLEELIAKQKQRVEDPAVGRAIVMLGGEEVTFEFLKLPAKEWLDLSAVHPPRAGSDSDASLGFNPHSLAAAYPVKAVRRVEMEAVEADGAEPREVLEPVEADVYKAMFAVLDAIHIDTVGTVLWALNVWQDRMEVAAARKASLGEPSKKSPSPES